MAEGFLIVNPRSGSDRPDAEELAAAGRERGVRVHVLAGGDDAAELAWQAETDALGVAGGDGSLAAAATVAIERDLPFVCVPFGTRNHFARDVGLDLDDPVAALDAFAGTNERRVDVGRVGERLFLNNLSIGVYAKLVHRRERHRRRREALARLRALTLLVRRHEPLQLTVNGDPLDARILLVSNNRYDLDLLSLGERPRLDEGTLYLHSAGGLLPGRWKGPTPMRTVTIGSEQHDIPAAIDGEPASFAFPLEITIEPRALRLLLPQPE